MEAAAGEITRGISLFEFAGSSNNLSNTVVLAGGPQPATRQSKSRPFGGSDFPVCSSMPAGIRADERTTAFGEDSVHLLPKLPALYLSLSLSLSSYSLSRFDSLTHRSLEPQPPIRST